MKLLVLTSEPITAEQLREALPGGVEPEQTEVMVVAPALQPNPLKFWLSDADESIAKADEVRRETIQQLGDSGGSVRDAADPVAGHIPIAGAIHAPFWLNYDDVRSDKLNGVEVSLALQRAGGVGNPSAGDLSRGGRDVVEHDVIRAQRERIRSERAGGRRSSRASDAALGRGAALRRGVEQLERRHDVVVA